MTFLDFLGCVGHPCRFLEVRPCVDNQPDPSAALVPLQGSCYWRISFLKKNTSPKSSRYWVNDWGFGLLVIEDIQIANSSSKSLPNPDLYGGLIIRNMPPSSELLGAKQNASKFRFLFQHPNCITGVTPTSTHRCVFPKGHVAIGSLSALAEGCFTAVSPPRALPY